MPKRSPSTPGSLTIYREIGDGWHECTTLAHLGAAQRALGRCADARASWSRALARYNQLDATDSDELRRADLLDLLASVDG